MYIYNLSWTCSNSFGFVQNGALKGWCNMFIQTHVYCLSKITTTSSSLTMGKLWPFAIHCCRSSHLYWMKSTCSIFQDGTIPSAPVWTQGLPTLEESNLPGSIQGLYYMDSSWISATCTIYIYILTFADEFHIFSWSCFLGVLNYVSILKHLQLQTVGMKQDDFLPMDQTFARAGRGS